MSAPTAARVERLSADQKKCGRSKRERNMFFQIAHAHAIQFKGTVQLIAAKSRQALMSWRWLYIWRLYFSFVRDLRSRGNLLSDTEFGDPLGKRPSAWGSPEGVGISGRTSKSGILGGSVGIPWRYSTARASGERRERKAGAGGARPAAAQRDL